MKFKITTLAASLSLLSVMAFPADAAPQAEKNPPNTKTGTTADAAQKPNPMAQPSPTDQIEGPSDLPTSGPLYLPVDFDVPGQSFVSSGPYIGIPLEYSGSNLIINSPNVNEDIALLNIRKNISQRLSALGRPQEATGSHILLSGIIESQAIYREAGGGDNNTSDIDLTTANLDAYILGPSEWTSGLLELSYDNNIGTQTGSFSSDDRLNNSHVFVNKAFVVLGDFQESPFYSSFGQMYVPFGVYSTTMVSSPLTKILARTKARAIVVGYKEQAVNSLNVSAYIFRGATEIDNKSRVNDGGLNLDYSFKMRRVRADVGAGVIGNIADSQGMQYTGNNNDDPPLFGGFGGPTETFTNAFGVVEQVNTGDENLSHRVPAYDVHALIGVGDNVQLIGEVIVAANHFSRSDMTFNDDGAKPQAFSLEAVYNIPWLVKPTSISVGYQQSRQALAIGLPSKRIAAVINRSFWKNTLQSLEFRHDINYSSDDVSTGSGLEGPSGGGHPVNMVTFQFDYYF